MFCNSIGNKIFSNIIFYGVINPRFIIFYLFCNWSIFIYWCNWSIFIYWFIKYVIIFYLFCKNERVKNFSIFALGLGMIFFGLETLKAGLAPLPETSQFMEVMRAFQATSLKGAIMCVFIGCATTALVHSSSATLALIITLASLGAMDLNSAAALALAHGAVIKPGGVGFLTAGSISGAVTLDARDAAAAATGESSPLFKVGSAEALPPKGSIGFAGGNPDGWELVETGDGLGYELRARGFTVLVY